MSKNFQKKLVWIFFLLLIGIGVFFRFYNLNWGAPFYFHPDERNLASLLSADAFSNMPSYFFKGTFSYGNLPTMILQLPKTLIIRIYPDVDIFALSIILLRLTS